MKPIIVFTGEGKGKSSAAVGIVARALGAGKRVSAVFFFKGWWQSGEKRFLEKLAGYSGKLCIEFIPVKKWVKAPDAETKKRVEAGVDRIFSMIQSKPFLIVADELITAYALKVIPLKTLIEVIALAKKMQVALILTGRGWPKRLSKEVDIITEMKKVKHWFDEGQEAIKGIDW